MPIALLSQEGSGIAKQIPRGVVPMGTILKVGALEPPRRFAPPEISYWLRPFGLAFAAAHDSGGEFPPSPTFPGINSPDSAPAPASVCGDSFARYSAALPRRKHSNPS